LTRSTGGFGVVDRARRAALMSFAQRMNLQGGDRVLVAEACDKSRAVRDFWAFFVACAESNYIESSFR
jgi:hypothetical protein